MKDALIPIVFSRLTLVNALIWAGTIFGSAVVAKASDQFIYLLLVLLMGSALSGAAIAAGEARAQRLARP